jgi:hypothetical protein
MGDQLKVVGAGMPRTGTTSQKSALEQLLGGSCYHMYVLSQERPEHVAIWHGALRGEPVDWWEFLADYTAAVDWPASYFWREISAANPDALVLLSLRDDPDAWWRSVEATILGVMRAGPQPEHEQWYAMARDLFSAGFSPDWDDADAAKAAYLRHNDAVRAEVPADRLLEWRAQDGWAPICERLGVPVPDEPFPRQNTTADWEQRKAEQAAAKDDS